MLLDESPWHQTELLRASEGTSPRELGSTLVSPARVFLHRVFQISSLLLWEGVSHKEVVGYGPRSKSLGS